MKVVVFTRDFPPDRGGVQTWMERVASFYGADASVLARRTPGDREYDQDRPYRVRRMPRFDWTHPNRYVNLLLRGLGLLLRFVVGGILVAEVIREQKSDVVHCAYVFPNGLPMMVVRILTGCPYVVYTYGTEVLRVMDRGGLPLLALRAVLRLAVRVVTTSEFMRSELARLVPADKVIVPPLGADSGALNPNAAPVSELGGVTLTDRRVLVTVGRIEMRKGHDLIARALPAIRAVQPGVLWVVVGDGPDRARIEALVRDEKITGNVLFTGRVSDAELSQILARAEVLVMPSRRIGPDVEGFGIVYLEAALFGVPSVGGRSGGVPDAVLDGETGLLCDSEDPADLARQVLRLLGDPELTRRLGEQAKQRARQRTWRECGAAVDRAVEPLIE